MLLKIALCSEHANIMAQGGQSERFRSVPWHGIDIDWISAIRQAICDEARAVVIGEVSIESRGVAQLGTKLCHLELVRACAIENAIAMGK